jgi:hypothetical protein
MGLVKAITKVEFKRTQKDLNLREEYRQNALRAEMNAFLARGERYFDYADRKDITEEDVQRIVREYKAFKPEIKSYRQPGEDIAQIFFNF